MSFIKIGIFSEEMIVSQGFESLLGNSSNMHVEFIVNVQYEVNNCLSEKPVNVLLIHLYEIKHDTLKILKQVNLQFPKVRILVISISRDQNDVLRVIKAGASGYLSGETDKNELMEAIYTIRNGYDYFSKSITHLLLNKYLDNFKTGKSANGHNIKTLSSREIEIVQHWGDGLTNREIAEKLFISVRTVESHKNHIMQKLNMKTSVDLVKFAIKNNIIQI